MGKFIISAPFFGQCGLNLNDYKSLFQLKSKYSWILALLSYLAFLAKLIRARLKSVHMLVLQTSLYNRT